jgi:hypothetical protein
MSVLPTADEIQQLLKHSENPSALRDIEQKVMPFCMLDRCVPRLKLMEAWLSHHATYQSLHARCMALGNAADEVKRSRILKKIMHMVLRLMNFINHGNKDIRAHGAAKGFSLESLNTLTSFKMESISTMHFVCITMRQAHGENFIDDLKSDLRHIHGAAKENSATLKAGVNAFGKDFAFVRREKEQLKEGEDTPSKAIAFARMSGLCEAMESENEELLKELDRAFTSSGNVQRYFSTGEKKGAAATPFEQFFGYFATFLVNLESAWNDIQRNPAAFRKFLPAAEQTDQKRRQRAPSDKQNGGRSAVQSPRSDAESVSQRTAGALRRMSARPAMRRENSRLSLIEAGSVEAGADAVTEKVSQPDVAAGMAAATKQKDKGKSQAVYQVGERVEGDSKSGWRKAIVNKINSDGTYTLAWIDGDINYFIKSSDEVRKILGPHVQTPPPATPRASSLVSDSDSAFMLDVDDVIDNIFSLCGGEDESLKSSVPLVSPVASQRLPKLQLGTSGPSSPAVSSRISDSSTCTSPALPPGSASRATTAPPAHSVQPEVHGEMQGKDQGKQSILAPPKLAEASDPPSVAQSRAASQETGSTKGKGKGKGKGPPLPPGIAKAKSGPSSGASSPRLLFDMGPRSSFAAKLDERFKMLQELDSARSPESSISVSDASGARSAKLDELFSTIPRVKGLEEIRQEETVETLVPAASHLESCAHEVVPEEAIEKVAPTRGGVMEDIEKLFQLDPSEGCHESGAAMEEAQQNRTSGPLKIVATEADSEVSDIGKAIADFCQSNPKEIGDVGQATITDGARDTSSGEEF